MKLIGTALGDNVYLSARTRPNSAVATLVCTANSCQLRGDAKIAEGRVNLRVDVADTVQQEDVGLERAPDN